MVERTANAAATAMSGAVIHGSPTALWRGVTLDSRRIARGELFFALPGEQVDGHRFAAQAAEKGAGAVVVHQDVTPPEGTDCAFIRVDNTYDALHALTRAVRREVPEHLVAITGSAGKTTTKEFVNAMLATSFRVARSPGNLNNLYGFPVSLLSIPDDCQWMVAEMGMSTPGELRQISLLGEPDIAVFTNVRPVHLENFPNLRGIAEAKAEILAGLRPGGVIVANADDPEVMRIAQRHVHREAGVRLVTFGFGAAADVHGSPPRPGTSGSGCTFEISIGEETVGCNLAVHGLYNAANALAGAAVAHVLGVSLAKAARAAGEVHAARRRGEVHRFKDGTILIDDVYNSNPAAVKLALESARHLDGKRHVAILGDMLELGPDEATFHRETGEEAARQGFDLVLGVGKLSQELVRGAEAAGSKAAWFETASKAARGIGTWVSAGDVVLLKGSRGVGLEVVVETLKEREGNA